jgi:uncharacterized phage protein (TIGR02218 family)
MMDALLGPLTSLAFCWRLERRDGICLGFTSHDRSLEVDGLLYRAAPGMVPSAISTSDGFDASALDVAGALSGEAISEADLLTGRWDRAAISVLLVDWRDPGAERLELARGELGDVSAKANGFEAELKGPAALLEMPVVEQTSPTCRASLGDRRCRVDMAGRVTFARVTAVAGEDEVDLDPAPPGGSLPFGRLRWIAGANSGRDSLILAAEGARVTLREPPPFAPVAGDLVEIAEGCDRTLATCAARFGNVANFRGEPHLPGLDLLTRYPGA